MREMTVAVPECMERRSAAGVRAAPACRRSGRASAFSPGCCDREVAVIDSCDPSSPSPLGLWFNHDGGASGSLRGLCESFRGSCKWIGGADVNVELALRESSGEPS